MADSAHVTANLQLKPSIFEVVAADSLQDSFYPAIKRVCTLLANNNPSKFGWLVRFYDEFYLLLNGSIQLHYIHAYGGSLAEIFYGLTRSLQTSNLPLTKQSKITVFICLVILPYLTKKIQQHIANWKLDENENPTNVQNRKAKNHIISIYNVSMTTWQCLQIYQYITYMANRSKTHSLLLQCVQMNLIHLPPESSINDSYSWTDIFARKIKWSTISTAFIFRGLELSAFFLQFIQWWQNEANHGDIANLPIPDAPAETFDVNSSKYAGKCPLCLQRWRMPTVISISGYVYCYVCIVKNMNEVSETCPVSGYPASIDDLLRIYDDC